MSVYAKGRKAVAISDRSGFRVPYKNLRTEWNGSRVAPDEYEPKHPQLTPSKNIIDATALFKPRPDNDPENISFYVGYNWFNTNETNLDSTLYDKPNPLVGKGSIGFAKISTTTDATPSGVAGTGAIGTEVPTASITEAGVAGTGAIGTEALTASITETGVAGTGAIGTEVPTASITETGVAGTGAIGTESVETDNPTWGTGTWGNGKWGQ
jgi:hypothetical protein